MTVHFTHPILLFGAIPAWYLLYRLAPARGLRGWLRYTFLGLLAVIAAGPVGPSGEGGSTVVLVVDQSQSMPPSLMAHKARVVAELNGQKREHDRLGIIRFAAIPLVEQYPNPDRPPQTSLGTKLNVEQTNLHAAIAAAIEVIPEQTGGTILIVSDGQADDEPTDQLLAELRRRGIAVHFELYPLDEEKVSGDIVLESVTAPTGIEQGTELEFQIQIVAEFTANASLHIRRDEEAVATMPIQLAPGPNTVRWATQGDQPGVFRYTLSVVEPNDPKQGNNAWELWVKVHGPRTVLVVNQTGLDSPITDLLRLSDVPYDVLAAAKLGGSLEKLSAYSACVLEDVGLTDLKLISPQILATFVERLGGGLVVTGGSHSFGTGGYRSSVLDPLLPVALRPLNVNERPNQALVILVDPSAWDAQGSIGQSVENELTPLQTALLAMVAELDPVDRVGIVTTRLPEPVVLPLTVAGNRDVRETITHLGFSSDRSAFQRALGEAWDMVTAATQVAKHLLVVVDTDQLGAWPPSQLDPFVTRPAANTTVTLVTWGTLDAANQAIWRSRLPSGRLFSTNDTRELASMLRRDWELTTGSSFVTRTTAMECVPNSIRGLVPPSSLPMVDGFHTATLRDQATGILRPVDIPTQPLMARWDRGLGRVCTILFQVGPVESGNGTGAHLASLLAEQVKWAGRTAEPERERAVVELTNRTATVRFPTGSGDNNAVSAPLELQISRADGTPSGTEPFTKDDAISVARFQLEGSASYLTAVQRHDQFVALCPPFLLPRSREFLRPAEATDGNTVLTRLAAVSGGSPWRLGTPIFKASDETFRSFVGIFACAALVLLIFDVADSRYGILGLAENQLRRQRARRRPAPVIEVGPSPDIADPFELAKERMRRRVQR